jgi:predicted nuclease of predicted toxin-antitoxin system
VEAREIGPDPGDASLLKLAAKESRILITIDTDFGQFVFLEGQAHAGLIRLPDVPTRESLEIVKELLERFGNELESHAIITVRGGIQEYGNIGAFLLLCVESTGRKAGSDSQRAQAVRTTRADRAL